MRFRRSRVFRFLLSVICLSIVFWQPTRLQRVGAVAASLEALQGYLDPAPLGIDARYAWTIPGGRGENVRLVDIEYSWNLDHSDLVNTTSNLFIYVRGVNPLPDPA